MIVFIGPRMRVCMHGRSPSTGDPFVPPQLTIRVHSLMQMAQDFMAVAERHSLAVVHINQVTTKIQEGQDSKLIPALGESNYASVSPPLHHMMGLNYLS